MCLRCYYKTLSRQGCSGFTLIELVAVMVVIGVVGTISTKFLVTSIDSYRETENRQKVLNKGRTTLEQLTRIIRSAAPNSARVSSSGSCLEVLPTVAGAFYEGYVSDAQNGVTSYSNSLSTSPLLIDLGTAEHAVIGALTADEIYTASTPSSRADIASASVDQVDFALPHQFVRNSPTRRVFITDDPVRFCVTGDSLVFYEDYGIEASMTDASPGGTTSIVATSLSARGTPFTLSGGTEDRNTTLDINLIFSRDNLNVLLTQTVFIRNVP